MDGVAPRASNDPRHEVETASETAAYAVSDGCRRWTRVHTLG